VPGPRRTLSDLAWRGGAGDAGVGVPAERRGQPAAVIGAGRQDDVGGLPESTTPTTFRQWCEEVLRPAVLA
jgi:hypothetical protein